MITSNFPFNSFSRINLILFFILHFLFHTASAEKILLLGDSNAKQFGQMLENMCNGAEVTNAGIGGTTADDWASFTGDIISTCSAKKWDVVYISVGGNDVDDSKHCSMTSEDYENLISSVANAVTNIMTNIAPGAKKYFMTGYCMIPFPSEEHVNCEDPKNMPNYDMKPSLMSKVTPPDGAEFDIVDSKYACGATDETWSDKTYFRNDGKHLNSKGYCTVFSQPEVQEILSCGNTLEDSIVCDSIPNIPLPSMGIEENCANLSIKGCVDSELGFLLNSKRRTCSWVQERNKDVLCDKDGGRIAMHCPKTCNKCDQYACTDIPKKFLLQNGNARTCQWVLNGNTKKRCKKKGVRQICRGVCHNQMCRSYTKAMNKLSSTD